MLGNKGRWREERAVCVSGVEGTITGTGEGKTATMHCRDKGHNSDMCHSIKGSLSERA